MLPTRFWFIWPSGFRGEDFLKLAHQKQELPVAAIFVNGSGQNVQSLEMTFYRCFLPSFSSFGWGVSEANIKMWKVNGRQTTDDGWRTSSDGKSFFCFNSTVSYTQDVRFFTISWSNCQNDTISTLCVIGVKRCFTVKDNASSRKTDTKCNM